MDRFCKDVKRRFYRASVYVNYFSAINNLDAMLPICIYILG
jgi:hypothetical protein